MICVWKMSFGTSQCNCGVEYCVWTKKSVHVLWTTGYKLCTLRNNNKNCSNINTSIQIQFFIKSYLRKTSNKIIKNFCGCVKLLCFYAAVNTPIFFLLIPSFYFNFMFLVHSSTKKENPVSFGPNNSIKEDQCRKGIQQNHKKNQNNMLNTSFYVVHLFFLFFFIVHVC